ncbi:MAG: quinate 5-dehydrogenase [Deinococcaceae bacterium]
MPETMGDIPQYNWQPAPKGYKHVVSISLGSTQGNARRETEFLGQPFVLERIGTNGDMEEAARLFSFLDGKVDAFGLGGADLAVVAQGRSYVFREIRNMISGAKQTPVVDGGGLKHTLERQAVRELDATIGWKGTPTLMVSAVDRFGMAETLAEFQADVLYGDVIFALGLPFPIRSIGGLRRLAGLVLPVVTQLPFKWFYPTGDRQKESVQGPGTRYYDWAQVIAGDTHYVKRYAPEQLTGKTLLSNTTTPEDIEWARSRGVSRLITTTPRIEGRSFGTNVMEACLVALSGEGRSLREDEYLTYIEELNLKPTVINL